MAIVNRTRDSFYDRGATYAEDAALERVRAVVAEGADLVDVGGVKAGPGDRVELAEEVRLTVPQGLRRGDARPQPRGAPGRHAGRHRRQRLAGGAGVPGARRGRDPADPRHGHEHPRRAAAGARRAWPGVITAAGLVPHPPLLLRELGGTQDPVGELR